MKITNKQNLPHEIYEALSQSNYDAGRSDYSVTTLLNPPRIVQLERRHWGELETDCMDRLWSLFGEVAHGIFERHTHEDAKAEERLYYNVLGRTIGGKFDNYRDGVISDFKITSAWTLVYGSRIHEWTAQLNLYALLLQKHNLPVTNIRVNCVLRDWDKNKALQSGDYPKSPIQIIPITLWSTEEQEEYILNRVKKQIDNEQLSDEELDWCTAEDTWEQASTYAVMKPEGKRAVRVLPTEEEALAYIEGSKDSNLSCVKRCGKRTRCSDYCNVSQFCNQYKDYLNEQEP